VSESSAEPNNDAPSGGVSLSSSSSVSESLPEFGGMGLLMLCSCFDRFCFVNASLWGCRLCSFDPSSPLFILWTLETSQGRFWFSVKFTYVDG
jgi:hypothetical protein